MGIYTAKLSRMSHCAPEAILKPVRFKFMPETVISNVLVVQVCCKAVPNMRSGSSKAPVAKCLCVRGMVHDLSVDGCNRHLRPSKTKRMSSAKYSRGAWLDKDEKTKHASLKSTRFWTGSQCN